MEAILFSKNFEAPPELDEYCKSLGYNNLDYPNNYDLMFDSRVIEFCKQRKSKLWGYDVYKGRKSSYYRVGFAGKGTLCNIDTSKKWIVRLDNVDHPIIQYVEVKVNAYGRVNIVVQNEVY